MYLLNYALYIVLLLTFYTVNNTNYLKDIPFTNRRHFKLTFYFTEKYSKEFRKFTGKLSLLSFQQYQLKL